jgi:hypothetical protein
MGEVIDRMRRGGGHDMANDGEVADGREQIDAVALVDRPAALMEACSGRPTCSSKVAAGFQGDEGEQLSTEHCTRRAGRSRKGGLGRRTTSGWLGIVVIFSLMIHNDSHVTVLNFPFHMNFPFHII